MSVLGDLFRKLTGSGPVEATYADLAKRAIDDIEGDIESGALSTEQIVEKAYQRALELVETGWTDFSHLQLWRALALEFDTRFDAAAVSARSAAPSEHLPTSGHL